MKKQYTKKELQQTIENKRNIICFYKQFIIDNKLIKKFEIYKQKYIIQGRK